ncbi:hypothetical protein [Streptomyces sp. YGL11-2]|uniref:hypothetical protein n=1 Tax=Streptomyces sp. YGL11-2 TaxID=3414028 RepID=UPI003CF2E4D6
MRAAVVKRALGLAATALVTAVAVTACAQERSDPATATTPLVAKGKGSFTATATCPKGMTVAGGGFTSRDQDANGSITESYPDTSNSWKVTITDAGLGNGAPIPHVTGTVYARCSK